MDALARRPRAEEPPIEGEHELFGFLTTEANAVVAPIHPKAMPAILTSPAEVDSWLEADTSDALALHGPCLTTRSSSSRRTRRTGRCLIFGCTGLGLFPVAGLC